MPREGGASSTLWPLDFTTPALEYWIARRSLSSGAHSRDPVAGDDSLSVGSFRKNLLPLEFRDGLGSARLGGGICHPVAGVQCVGQGALYLERLLGGAAGTRSDRAALGLSDSDR